VSVGISFNGINYQYVKGFFGDQADASIPAQTVEFNAFGKSLTRLMFHLLPPQLSFTVSNDYGVPTKVTFSPLEAKKIMAAT